jgi:hypothetical protein
MNGCSTGDSTLPSPDNITLSVFTSSILIGADDPAGRMATNGFSGGDFEI